MPGRGQLGSAGGLDAQPGNLLLELAFNIGGGLTLGRGGLQCEQAGNFLGVAIGCDIFGQRRSRTRVLYSREVSPPASTAASMSSAGVSGWSSATVGHDQ